MSLIFDVKEYIDPSKVRMYITTPNKTIIGELNEAFDVTRNIKVGNTPTLQFKIPYTIDVRKEIVTNPNIVNTKVRFLIKFVYDTTTEWYVIKTPTDTMSDTDSKSILAYGLGYQLTDKNIRNYTATSINATAALTVALSQTNWSIGSIDASFDLLFRSFNVTDSNCLDFVFLIATTFNAQVDFNTVNKQVNFSIFENNGVNMGLEVSYGHLLKSATKVENTDKFFSRLKVFGANGISIQGQNSVGSNYIEDYSYFLNGYAEDAFGVAISHSTEGMSDSLCKALIKYKNLIATSEGTYQGYLTSLSGYQVTLTTQNNLLTTYQTDLALIQDNISLANYNKTDTTALVAQQTAKQTQINSQNTAIATTQSNINSVNANITTLKNTLAISTNFTALQISEWNDYIIVGTFENTNVTDPKQLLQLAKAEFEKLKQPKIVVDISIVNFLECVEEKAKWNMLNLGDIITIKNVKIGLNVTAKIIEMNFNYENGDIGLVISNVKELLSLNDQFFKDMYRANTTSSNVGSNDYKWNDAVTGVDAVSQVINNNWLAAQRTITASENESVEISRKGILIKDITDPNKLVILQHGIIALSLDKGNTWKTAITPDGITAQRLIGQIIMGNNLTITDNNGQLTIVGNLMTIKDASSITRVLLGEYATGKFGLKLMNKSGTATVLDEDGILQTDTIQLADNVDNTHGLKLKFFIDGGVINVRAVKLNFSLEPFRAYSTGAANGGGAAVTSSSGGSSSPTSSSGGGSTATSSSGGSSTQSSDVGSWQLSPPNGLTGDFMNGSGGHNHGIPNGTLLALSGGGSVSYSVASDHSHSMYSVNHTHTVSVPSHSHSVNILDHTHYVNVPSHTHDVAVPAHTHAIQYGIYEGTSATGVNVKVDGVIRNSSGYTSDQSNIDLTTWITTSGWHTVELTSTQLGRINAALYIKNFITT